MLNLTSAGYVGHLYMPKLVAAMWLTDYTQGPAVKTFISELFFVSKKS